MVQCSYSNVIVDECLECLPHTRVVPLAYGVSVRWSVCGYSSEYVTDCPPPFSLLSSESGWVAREVVCPDRPLSPLIWALSDFEAWPSSDALPGGRGSSGEVPGLLLPLVVSLQASLALMPPKPALLKWGRYEDLK